MGRKRSRVHTQAIKDAVRKAQQRKSRLFSAKVCPWCNVTNIVQMQYNGKAWVKDPLHTNRLIRIRVGKLRCILCSRTLRAGLLPGEDLIDLYCYWYDEQIAEIWYDIGLKALFERWFICDEEAYQRQKAREAFEEMYNAGMDFIFNRTYTERTEEKVKKKKKRHMRSQMSIDIQEMFEKGKGKENAKEIKVV